MSEPLEAIRTLIDEYSVDERKALKRHLQELLPHPLETEWGIDADTILTAIRRSSDLTKRGERGFIAEAVFESDIVPKMKAYGWESAVVAGDVAYDALLRKGERSARIQIKLQRLEKGEPKLYYPKHYKDAPLYVVETQRTRSGEKITRQVPRGTKAKVEIPKAVAVQTRPYPFGDCDILAVNLHPSTKDWRSFRYTLGSWLLPRRNDKSLVEVFQPVSAKPNEVWTDSLATCLEWFVAGKTGSILTEVLRLTKSKRPPAESRWV